MSSTFEAKERTRQDTEYAMSEAIDLRIEGKTYVQIGATLGVDVHRVERLLKESPRMVCACGERLAKPVPGDTCGFCLAEKAVPA